MMIAVQFLSAFVILELFFIMFMLLIFVPFNFFLFINGIVFDKSECVWLLINTVSLFYLKIITSHFPPLVFRALEVRSLIGLR